LKSRIPEEVYEIQTATPTNEVTTTLAHEMLALFWESKRNVDTPTCSLKFWSAVGSFIHFQIDSFVQNAHEKIDEAMN
jgi:hypothetical protein